MTDAQMGFGIVGLGRMVVDWAQRHDIPSPLVTLAQQLPSLYRDAHEDPPLPMAPAVALVRHGFGGDPLHGRQPDRD